MVCRICGRENKGKIIQLNGICFGTVGTWDYFKCDVCGCLQIKDIPCDLDKYYDIDHYFSFNTSTEGLRSRMWDHLFKYQLNGKDILGKIIESVFPSNYKFMRNVSKTASIIDIGCGDGHRLRQLQNKGYMNLFGLEPYIKENINYSNNGKNIVIFKGSLDDPTYLIDRKFDYIIFEHSFEHICDEHMVLARARELLNPNGSIVIKIPQFSEYYWRKLGINQVIFDPPRHIYIHTYKSMNFMAQKYGMKIVDYSTETDPTEYIVASNVKKNKAGGIKGIPILQLLGYGILTFPIRRHLDKIRDGAYATFVLQCK